MPFGQCHVPHGPGSKIISHGHVLVDGKRVNIPSLVLQPNQKVTLTDKGVQNQIYLRAKQSPRLEVADYLRVEEESGKPVGFVQNTPGLEHVPFTFDAGLFTEYYAARNV
jgi:small subunit ribosomal protein S4